MCWRLFFLYFLVYVLLTWQNALCWLTGTGRGLPESTNDFCHAPLPVPLWADLHVGAAVQQGRQWTVNHVMMMMMMKNNMTSSSSIGDKLHLHLSVDIVCVLTASTDVGSIQLSLMVDRQTLTDIAAMSMMPTTTWDLTENTNWTRGSDKQLIVVVLAIKLIVERILNSINSVSFCCLLVYVLHSKPNDSLLAVYFDVFHWRCGRGTFGP